MGREDFIGCRFDPTVLAQIDAHIAAQGLSRSEWFRTAAIEKLDRDSVGDPNLAYSAARQLIPPILRNILREAMALVPETYDEAVQRYSVISPDPSRRDF